MTTTTRQESYIPSDGLPTAYDRQLAALHGLPDVTKVKPTTIRVVPPLGIGGAQTFVVQTYRHREQGDTIFLEVVGETAVRIVIPAVVANTIARQRDALTARSRSRAGKERAERDKAAGIKPGFTKARRK
jgi:hypothetical protein